MPENEIDTIDVGMDDATVKETESEREKIEKVMQELRIDHL
jgi:beta-lactamase superfamily II metal-dependent hydrolase